MNSGLNVGYWKQIKGKLSQSHIIFGIAFVLCFAFLMWKVRYGYVFNDEPFILTTSHRLTFGDALLVDEWHPAQMTGFLLYPLTKLYLAIQGTTDGIILFFRYAYVFLWLLVGLFCYCRLKKYGKGNIWTIIAIVYILLFTPLDQMTLSYNFFSLSCILMSGIIMITVQNKKDLIIIGILLAISILASPYIIILYIGYACIIAVSAIFHIKEKKTSGSSPSFLSFKSLLLITLGALIIAVPFLIFVLSRAGLKEIAANIPYIFNDPEHQARSFTQLIKGYIESFKVFNVIIHFGIPIIIISLLDRNRNKRRIVYIFLLAIVFCITMKQMVLNYYGNFNYVMLPISVMGLEAYILTDRKNPRFLLLWILGILYSMCVFTSSNLGMMAISMAVSVSGFSSFILIGDLFNEITKSYNDNVNSSGHNMKTNENSFSTSSVKKRNALIQKIFAYTIVLVCIVQVGSEGYIRYKRTYWDNDISMLNVTIKTGSAKGIITTNAHAESYAAINNDITAFFSTVKHDKSKVLIASLQPWAYLSINMPYATYSTWLNEDVNEKLLRLEKYYSLHKDMVPKYVYVLKSDIAGYTSQILSTASEHGYEIKETHIAYIMIRAE